MPSKWTARKIAQRLMPDLSAQTCAECGGTHRLQRHHPDYAKPAEFVVLCQACHIKADMRDGHRRTKQMKACRVCGKGFYPTHSKKHSTCSPACLSILGRANALKRWRPGEAVHP